MKRHWARVATIPVALALLVAACGDDDDSGGATTAAAGGEATTTAASSGDTATTEASSDTESTEGDTATTTDEGASTPAGGTQDFDGAEVMITGSERDDPSVIAINTALKAFGEANNIEITFTGDADWEANINTQVQGGNPPNIGIFPQPGKFADFAKAGIDQAARRQTSPRRHRELGRPTTPTTPNVDGKFSTASR